MDQGELRKYIRKHGKYKCGKGRTAEYAVVCTACGKEIRSTEEAGMSITKRHSALFWHLGCQGRVWNSKMQWEEREHADG